MHSTEVGNIVPFPQLPFVVKIPNNISHGLGQNGHLDTVGLGARHHPYRVVLSSLLSEAFVTRRSHSFGGSISTASGNVGSDRREQFR